MNKLPKGFLAAGVACQIKSSGARDLALIVNNGPLRVGAAVFTTNRVEAAPVTWSRQVVADGEVSAILLNSGGANACTGPDGFADTHKSAEFVGKSLNVNPGDVLVCSTGLIGQRLPMDKLLAGIALAKTELSEIATQDFAEAIMTTDTHPKFINKSFGEINFYAAIKGAGMLAPALATMLCVIATDAIIASADADAALQAAVAATLNRIDSDGCTSTNDTVALMASGASGVEISTAALTQALTQILSELAQELVRDAEGKTKVVEIKVINAANTEDALQVGRACARNNLLKCAINGEDPNWGRVLAAVGTTEAAFDPWDIDVWLNGVQVCRSSAPGEDRALVDMSNEDVEILIDLKTGTETASIWTNDLSAMYVHENSAYSS